jgi:hypothetical protein
VITPYFKFPDWVKIRHQIIGMLSMKVTLVKKRKISIIDINKATQEELIKIYGIEMISLRILKLKENLGALCLWSR